MGRVSCVGSRHGWIVVLRGEWTLEGEENSALADMYSSSLGARLEGRSQACSPFSVGKQGIQAFKAMSPGEITQCSTAERGLRLGPGHPNAVVWRREEAEGIVRALGLRA